jgi:hypothetical protein
MVSCKSCNMSMLETWLYKLSWIMNEYSELQVWCKTSILLIWLSEIMFCFVLFMKQMDELQVIRGFVKAAKRLRRTMCKWSSRALRDADIF